MAERREGCSVSIYLELGNRKRAGEQRGGGKGGGGEGCNKKTGAWCGGHIGRCI